MRLQSPSDYATRAYAVPLLSETKLSRTRPDRDQTRPGPDRTRPGPDLARISKNLRIFSDYKTSGFRRSGDVGAEIFQDWSCRGRFNGHTGEHGQYSMLSTGHRQHGKRGGPANRPRWELRRRSKADRYTRAKHGPVNRQPDPPNPRQPGTGNRGTVN